MSSGGGGSPSGQGGGTTAGLPPEERLRACVLLYSTCACTSAKGESIVGLVVDSNVLDEMGGGLMDARVGVVGDRVRVLRSEGCSNGFSDVRRPEVTADSFPVQSVVSMLASRSSTEGLGECTATSMGGLAWSMSSRGTPYPSRVTSTVSCDLKGRVLLPGFAAVEPTEDRPARTRLAVRVTLAKRDGPGE